MPSDSVSSGSPQRPAKGAKSAARRVELADAALETLAELGYARTSLREIAQKSEFTHGVLHYYFADKSDLIRCSARQYQVRCATRYDAVIADAETRDELLKGFMEKIGDTLENEAPLHRLWYDLRSQALFDGAFQAEVKEIDNALEDTVWRVVKRYAELGSKQVFVSSAVFYAAFDGLFQKHLLRFLSNDEHAAQDLIAEIAHLMPMLA